MWSTFRIRSEVRRFFRENRLKKFDFRPLSSDYKLTTYLRIARLYLEDDDPVQAEVFINRASLLQNETRDEKLQILYRVSYERGSRLS